MALAFLKTKSLALYITNICWIDAPASPSANDQLYLQMRSHFEPCGAPVRLMTSPHQLSGRLSSVSKVQLGDLALCLPQMSPPI